MGPSCSGDQTFLLPVRDGQDRGARLVSARLIVIYVLAVLLAIGVVLYLSTACSYQSFGPHKPDKAVFAGELTWVLKPGGS